MERLKQRFHVARQALESLKEILKKRKSKVVRDAAIQRFEYTFETVWKAAQLYLEHFHGLKFVSPKNVIRGSGQVKVLNVREVRLALRMADDRNLTVHTYNEDLAEDIFRRLPPYAKMMDAWLRRMRDAAGKV